MKTLKLLLSGVVLCGLMTATLRSQSPAVIKIDLDRKIAQIDPNIYGAFVEPIRTVVYGSIYDPKSPFAEQIQDFRPWSRAPACDSNPGLAVGRSRFPFALCTRSSAGTVRVAGWTRRHGNRPHRTMGVTGCVRT